MATVHDVAAYILRRHGPMSAMKLQKIVYYSQAWVFVLTGRVLFHEQIQAWAHGPVVYELFDRHRGQFVVGEWAGEPSRLEVAERAIIDRVLGHYGRMSAVELSKLTHDEPPWRQARAGLPDGLRSIAVITPESMRRYYAAQRVPFAK